MRRSGRKVINDPDNSVHDHEAISMTVRPRGGWCDADGAAEGLHDNDTSLTARRTIYVTNSGVGQQAYAGLQAGASEYSGLNDHRVYTASHSGAGEYLGLSDHRVYAGSQAGASEYSGLNDHRVYTASHNGASEYLGLKDHRVYAGSPGGADDYTGLVGAHGKYIYSTSPQALMPPGQDPYYSSAYVTPAAGQPQQATPLTYAIKPYREVKIVINGIVCVGCFIAGVCLISLGNNDDATPDVDQRNRRETGTQHERRDANRPPVVRRNNFVLWPEQRRVVTANMLSAADPDTAFSDIVFNVSGISHAEFQNQMNATIRVFHQDELIAGNVSFVPQGQVAPRFNFTISDGETVIGPFTANICFNPKGVHFVPEINPDHVDGRNGMIIRGVAGETDTGYNVRFVGDLNRDGADELAFMASSQTKAYVLSGVHFNGSREFSLVDMSPQYGFVIKDVAVGNTITEVAPASDLNEDGFADMMFAVRTGSQKLVKIIRGEYNLSDINLGEGYRHETTINGASYSDQEFFSLGVLGDFNGDGHTDVYIGDNNIRGAYIIHGNPAIWNQSTIELSQLPLSARQKIFGGTEPGAGRFILASSSSASDFDADGYDDLVIGRPEYRVGTGYAWLVYGGSAHSLDPDTNLATLNQPHGSKISDNPSYPTSFAGGMVSHVGDFSGSGYTGILIGDYGGDGLAENGGECYVLSGRRARLPGAISLSDIEQYGFSYQGKYFAGYAGIRVHGVNDFNGDGLADLAVSETVGQTASSLFIIFGSNQLDNMPNMNMPLENFNGKNGVRITRGESDTLAYFISSGDFNGDGAVDLAVSYQHDQNEQVHIINGASDDIFSLSNQQVTMQCMGNFSMTTAHINATCLYYGPGEITLIPEAVEYGQFEATTNPGASLEQFTQAQIDQGQIVLVSTSPNHPPHYQIKAQAGFWITRPDNVTVVFNTPPRISRNQFTIHWNQPLSVNTSHLSAEDDEMTEAQLAFTVEYVEHGSFFSQQQNATVVTFSQQRIREGDISFAPDRSNIRPIINVSVSDGMASVGPQRSDIIFVERVTTPTTTPTSTPTSSATTPSTQSPTATVPSTRFTTTNLATLFSTTMPLSTSSPTATLASSGDTSTTVIPDTTSEVSPDQELPAVTEHGFGPTKIIGVTLLLAGIGFLASSIYLLLRYWGDNNMASAFDISSKGIITSPLLLKQLCEQLFDAVNVRRYGYISEAYAQRFQESVSILLVRLAELDPSLDFEQMNAKQQQRYLNTIITVIKESLLGHSACWSSSANAVRFFTAEITPQQIESNADRIAEKVHQAMNRASNVVAMTVLNNAVYAVPFEDELDAGSPSGDPLYLQPISSGVDEAPRHPFGIVSTA